MLAIRHLAYPDTANNPDNEALTRDKGKHKKREKHIFRAYQRQTAKPFRPETGTNSSVGIVKAQRHINVIYVFPFYLILGIANPKEY